MRAASQLVTASRPDVAPPNSRSLRRLCLLGHDARTVAALGRLLGKSVHIDLPASFQECLSLLCTRGRVNAFVVDAGSSDDSAKLLEFLFDRQSPVPTFVFTASEDHHLAALMGRLGITRVFRKPADIWKLSEEILRELGLGGAGIQPRTRNAMKDVVARAIDFIAEHLSEINSAADVSRHVGVSREHLSRQFTKYTSCTLWDFVTVCRMEKARQLLRERGLPVKEVASRVGYGCQSTFFRAFAQHAGLTPNQYRTLNREGR